VVRRASSRDLVACKINQAVRYTSSKEAIPKPKVGCAPAKCNPSVRRLAESPHKIPRDRVAGKVLVWGGVHVGSPSPLRLHSLGENLSDHPEGWSAVRAQRPKLYRYWAAGMEGDVVIPASLMEASWLSGCARA